MFAADYKGIPSFHNRAGTVSLRVGLGLILDQRHRLLLQILDRDLLAVSIEILSVTFFGADGLALEPIPVLPLGLSPSLDVKLHL